MKQRKSKQVRLFSGMLIGIVMIAVLARIVYLNHCYPSPKVITYTDNDTIKLGNYEIKQTGWEWGDGSLLKEKCPDYAYDHSGRRGRSGQAASASAASGRHAGSGRS